MLVLVKPDPEGKSVLHHILLNASNLNLKYLLDSFGDLVSFNSISLDTNDAVFLAFNLAGFSKYKDRCQDCIFMVLDHYKNKD